MSVPTDSIMDKDLYELFGVLQQASVKDIKTAYRKKALECHPDKNPDNPRANELFLELSRALAVLIDEPARAAYDKVLNAKFAAKKRHQLLDSKRKKFKQDLDEKEKQTTIDVKANEENFQKELERLRKMTHQQVEEELNYVRNLVKERKAHNNDLTADNVFRLKIKWSVQPSPSSHDYSTEQINQIFSKYGCVSAIAMLLRRKGSAIVEFSDKNAAMNAFKLEKGFVKNPLTISWVGPPPEDLNVRNSHPIYDTSNTKAKCDEVRHQSVSEDSVEDFEAAVLRRLREAEQTKKQSS